MKKSVIAGALALAVLLCGAPVALAKINLGKAASGIGKMAQAVTLTESQLTTLGQALAGAKYSQKQENEADDFGYDFLKSNGNNPWGMVMAFEKLDSMSGSSKSSMIDRMFSSHPQTVDRIARMTKRCEKDNIARS